MKKILTGIFLTAAILTVSVTSVWAHGHGGHYNNAGNCQYCTNSNCYNGSYCGANYTDENGDGICDNYYLRTNYQGSNNYGTCHGGGHCHY